MTDCNKRLMYLKQLYLNAGKAVMDENIKYFKRCVDFQTLNTQFNTIAQNPYDSNISICDKGGAYFHILAQKLCKEIFEHDTVFLVMSPYYNAPILWQIFVPEKNALISNKFSFNHCICENLYAKCDATELKEYNLSIAADFFYKSEKI